VENEVGVCRAIRWETSRSVDPSLIPQQPTAFEAAQMAAARRRAARARVYLNDGRRGCGQRAPCVRAMSCNETHLAIVVIRSRAHHHTAHIEDPPGGFYLYLAALEHPRVYISDQPALCQVICPLRRRCPLFVDHVPFHVGRAPLVTPVSCFSPLTQPGGRLSTEHRQAVGSAVSSPASGTVPGAYSLWLIVAPLMD
jgi:hypothetical protein